VAERKDKTRYQGQAAQLRQHDDEADKQMGRRLQEVGEHDRRRSIAAHIKSMHPEGARNSGAAPPAVLIAVRLLWILYAHRPYPLTAG